MITDANGIFRGVRDTFTPLLVTVGLSIVNLILDPLLIFGFDLGVQGAAIASVVAQWGGAIAFVWLFGPRTLGSSAHCHDPKIR